MSKPLFFRSKKVQRPGSITAESDFAAAGRFQSKTCRNKKEERLKVYADVDAMWTYLTEERALAHSQIVLYSRSIGRPRGVPRERKRRPRKNAQSRKSET